LTAKHYLPTQFHLRLKDTRDYQLPDGKYFLYKKDVLVALERHLSHLNQKGLLKSAVMYFGTVTDPFQTFHKKFDITTGCLELLEKYRPGRLVVQTRSPMVIAALPMFRLLGESAVAAIPVETHLERSVLRYTPGMPRISERLVAAQGLRRQGVTVNAVVSPVLPYGDFERDAWDFAELLDRHADYISLGALTSGSETEERQLRDLPISQKIAADKNFPWLRPHACKPLFEALKVIAPHKLHLPVQPLERSSQLTLFAA
jgi:DNA repair photolyase